MHDSDATLFTDQTNVLNATDCVDKCNKDINCDIVQYANNDSSIKCKHGSYGNIMGFNGKTRTDIILDDVANNHLYFKNKDMLTNWENLIESPFTVNTTETNLRDYKHLPMLIHKNTSKINNYNLQPLSGSSGPNIDQKTTTFYNCIGSCDQADTCSHFQYNFIDKQCSLKSGPYLKLDNDDSVTLIKPSI